MVRVPWLSVTALVVVAGLAGGYWFVAAHKDPQNPQSETSVLSTSNNGSNSSDLTSPSPFPTLAPLKTAAPTTYPSPKPTTLSTPQSSLQSNQSSDLHYPNSTLQSSSGSTTTYTSSDDPDSITTWYKNKINSLGYNSKSFVTTKTNGNVENKLVGANGSKEIRVEIKKGETQSTITIIVTTS